MQEERRQHDHRNRVAPIEHPVDTIEPAAEREGEQTEERDRQPEEMQRGLIGGPARAHGRADEQREDADRGQHVVVKARAARHRRQRDVWPLPASRAAAACRYADRPAAAWCCRVSTSTRASTGWLSMARRMSPARTPARLAADGVATSAATTPTARSTQSTPSSTSLEVARETTLARPRASSASVTATGKAVCRHSRHHDSRSYTLISAGDGLSNSLSKRDLSVPFRANGIPRSKRASSDLIY